METASINSIRISYVRKGSGVPLLLVHGYPLDHSIWEPVADRLGKDFDLVIPDLRGFGSTSVIETPYSMDDMAGDFASLLDHLGIEKAFIAGHSMGGYVALAFVRKFAGRARGLALVSSQAAADPDDRKAARYKTADEVGKSGTGSVIDGLVSKLSPSPAVQDVVRGVMSRQPAGGFVGALKAMAERPDSIDQLAALKIPLVIVHGTADALIPLDRARDIKTAAPQADLVELAGVGHMPMLEAPEETAAAIRRLL